MAVKSIEGVWYEQRGRIMTFTAYQLAGDLENLWEQATRETLAKRGHFQLYLGLYDFSEIKIAASHLRVWNRHIASVAAHLDGHYAVVINPRLFEPVVAVINQQHAAGMTHGLRASIFTSKEKAYAYLDSQAHAATH